MSAPSTDRPRGTQQPTVERFPGAAAGSQMSRRLPGRRRLAYAVIALLNRVLPKSPRKVVLHSTIDLEDGVLAILQELAARGWHGTVLLEDARRARQLRVLAGHHAATASKLSVRGVLHFLTARYVITTEHLYGNSAPPASQVVVNIWHGEGPKGVGRHFPGQGGLRCSYAPVLSTFGRAFRSSEFDLAPEQVPVVGAPRNDRMLRADGAAARRALVGDDDRPVFLWLPSYRVGQFGGRSRIDAHTVYPGLPFSAADLHRLDDWLLEHGARIVVKLHPHDAADFTGDFKALRLLEQAEMERLGLTVYTALPAFDALLTDLSSIWTDHLLLDRPQVFPFPDLDTYRDGRGLNLEPYEHWLPGPLALDMDQLLAALGDLVAGRDPMRDERGRARLLFHSFHDDRSTARLLDGLGILAG